MSNVKIGSQVRAKVEVEGVVIDRRNQPSGAIEIFIKTNYGIVLLCDESEVTDVIVPYGEEIKITVGSGGGASGGVGSVKESEVVTSAGSSTGFDYGWGNFYSLFSGNTHVNPLREGGDGGAGNPSAFNSAAGGISKPFCPPAPEPAFLSPGSECEYQSDTFNWNKCIIVGLMPNGDIVLTYSGNGVILEKDKKKFRPIDKTRNTIVQQLREHLKEVNVPAETYDIMYDLGYLKLPDNK